MRKYENVDLLASLSSIMRHNTAHYQSDIEYDKDTIKPGAVSNNPENKRFLWMSRPSGTNCFRERDVFFKDTYANNTWRFYGEQTHDRILAYAVEVTGKSRGKVMGNLYKLNYQEHFAHVQKTARPISYARLIFNEKLKQNERMSL